MSEHKNKIVLQVSELNSAVPLLLQQPECPQQQEIYSDDRLLPFIDSAVTGGPPCFTGHAHHPLNTLIVFTFH